MNMNLVVLLYVLIVLLLVQIPLFYLLYRNEKVCKYRKDLLDRIFNSGNWNQLIIYYHNISYYKMLYSFKPLKDKYWFDEEFINKLNSK